MLDNPDEDRISLSAGSLRISNVVSALTPRMYMSSIIWSVLDGVAALSGGIGAKFS